MEQSDSADAGAASSRSLSRGSSVSEIVKQIDGQREEGQGKRGRSESGDAAPAGKRGALAPGRSPSASQITGSMKEYVNNTIEDMETRIAATLSRELYDLKEAFRTRFEEFEDRLRDLEKHQEEKDLEIENLTRSLEQARQEIQVLHTRTEEAEINSRLPCLILSGGSMAPRQPSRRQPPGSAPAPGTAGRSPAPQAETTLTGPGLAAGEGSQPASDTAAAGGVRRRGERDSGREEREDINTLVVNTLNRSLPGLNITEGDID